MQWFHQLLFYTSLQGAELTIFIDSLFLSAMPLPHKSTTLGILRAGKNSQRVSPIMLLSWGNINQLFPSGISVHATCFQSFAIQESAVRKISNCRTLACCSAQNVQKTNFLFHRFVSVTVMDSFQNVPSSPLLTTSWTVNFQSSTPLCSWLSTSALKKRHPARVSSQIKKKYLCLACDSEKEKKKSTSCGFLLTLRRERERERDAQREREERQHCTTCNMKKN